MTLDDSSTYPSSQSKEHGICGYKKVQVSYSFVLLKKDQGIDGHIHKEKADE